MSEAEETLSNICLTIVADSADQCAARKLSYQSKRWAEKQGSENHYGSHRFTVALKSPRYGCWQKPVAKKFNKRIVTLILDLRVSGGP